MKTLKSVVSTKELVELGLPASTAAKLRAKGEGPNFIRRGRRIQYFRADVAAWLEAQRVVTSPARKVGDCHDR